VNRSGAGASPNTDTSRNDVTMPFAGRTAMVTGAGRGIGRAVALALGAAGADLVLIARSGAQIEDVARLARSAASHAVAQACDVTDLPAVETVVADHPEIDILVNCAGTNIPGPFIDVGTAAFDQVIGLNLRSVFFVTQCVVRHMAAHGRGGSIVNVTSQMGHVGAANRSIYCASKHAVEGLTKALAVELASLGIRVNAVAPTFVETDMTRPFLADPGFSTQVLASLPIGRLGTPQEVAAAVIFLASPAASLITGASLLVDGGWTAH